MKKLIAALLSSVWVLSLSACNSVYVTENVNLTVSETTESNSTDATEEYSATSTVTTQLDDTEISPLDLLNYYIDEEGCYRVDQNKIKATDNYDLFRKYFFGTWNGRFCYADEKTEQESLIIDDSLNSYNMTNPGICFVGMFYEVEDHVLAFITGGIEGSCLHWLDMDNPHTMYIAWGGVTENNWLWTRNEDGVVSKIPVVYSLTKTDIPPNEPEENFLSIFKLYEISRDYGIDWDMLVHIEYNREEDSGIRYRVHNDSYDFYPVYLVSEAPDKLEFKTQVGNRYVECIDIKYTIEKIDGKWTRTVVFKD